MAIESWAACWLIGSAYGGAVLDANKYFALDYERIQSIKISFFVLSIFCDVFYTCKLYPSMTPRG
jgi:hypothetical protein